MCDIQKALKVANKKVDTTTLATNLSDTHRPLLAQDWKQQWTRTALDTISDQYGFSIEKLKGGKKPWVLSWKGTTVCQVHRVTTAKLISLILMNDIIMFTPTQKNTDENE